MRTYFEKARAACALMGLGMALTAACSESATEGGTDSNTHWMDACVSDAECGSLECHCGLCTRECDGAEACVAAGAQAECAPSAACGSATGGEVCVLRCDGEGECPGDLRCDGGQCVPGAAKDASVPEGGDGRDGGTDPDAATPFEGCAPPAPDCDAMDAGPDGTECARVAGYTWDGGRCSPVECGCAGSDCGALYATEADCTAARSECYAAAGSCELPFETRLCDANIPRYTYDPVAAGCRGVTFGGCDATANNFGSLEACESACRARADGCSLCPGGVCGTEPHDDCSACPADRDSSGEACSVEGLSCFFGPGCGRTTCDCAPGDAGGLVWMCISNLC